MFLCCCTGCIYLNDSILREDQPDPGDSYTVIDGDWSVASNKLVTSDSNAVLKINTDQPDNQPYFAVAVRLDAGSIVAGNSYFIRLGSDGPMVKYSIVNNGGVLRCLTSLCDSSGTVLSVYDQGIGTVAFSQVNCLMAFMGDCWTTTASRAPGQVRFGGSALNSFGSALPFSCGTYNYDPTFMTGGIAPPFIDYTKPTDDHAYFGTGIYGPFIGDTPDITHMNVNPISGTWTYDVTGFSTSDSNAVLEILATPPDLGIENWLGVQVNINQPALGGSGPDSSAINTAKISNDGGNHFFILNSGNTWFDSAAPYPAGDISGGGGPAGVGAIVIGAEPSVALDDKVLVTGNFGVASFGNLGPAFSGTLADYLIESGFGGTTAAGNNNFTQALGICMQHGVGYCGYLGGGGGVQLPPINALAHGFPAIGRADYDPPRGANPGANHIVLATGTVYSGPVKFIPQVWYKTYNNDLTGVNETNTYFGTNLCSTCGQQCPCGNDAPAEIVLDLGTGLTAGTCDDCTTLAGEFTLRGYVGTLDGVSGEGGGFGTAGYASCNYIYSTQFCPTAPLEGFTTGDFVTISASIQGAHWMTAFSGIDYSTPYINVTINISGAMTWHYDGPILASASCLGDVTLIQSGGDPAENVCDGTFGSTLTLHFS